jgi:hypothetical protein
MCQGVLSWLCFNAEPAAKNTADDPPQYRRTAAPSAADLSQSCLSRQQVRGGYPRYRVINGRHCWYASTPGRRQARRAKIDVNPYDDPIWKQSDVSGNELAKNSTQNCEEQALKLDSKEKQTFMRECTSNNMQ